ncbi:MAG: GtrA family protein [Treponemataceae bacterium]|nr:MAG: GtrA family protein [Treponemataceae bacterium]
MKKKPSVAELYHQNKNRLRELFVYGIVGGMTTVISFFSYVLFTRVCLMDYKIATAAAFVTAAIFAFFGNKFFVFKSKNKDPKVELMQFFAMRLVMFALEFSIMFVSVDILKLNDLVMKITATGIVIAGNYLCSKLIIFRKK